MLILDGDTSRIPVLIFTTSSSGAGVDDSRQAADEMIDRFVPCSLN
jgi:hypothetical protein